MPALIRHTGAIARQEGRNAPDLDCLRRAEVP
jgi:hypothetical protein